jgi:NADPH:quinone reductase-like Zn-dependent oxidoreductase
MQLLDAGIGLLSMILGNALGRSLSPSSNSSRCICFTDPCGSRRKPSADSWRVPAQQQRSKAMTKTLEGKTAVITGGTEGIGLVTAKLFVKQGAYVFITGRRQKELDEAAKAIGSNATGVQGDVTKMADLDLLYETVGKLKGRVDIIFANTGVGEFVPFDEVSEEHFDKLININVKGAFFTVQKGLPLLKD